MKQKKKSNCQILSLIKNTTNKRYGLFTDQVVAITKGKDTVVLEPEDLRELERVIGGKFKA